MTYVPAPVRRLDWKSTMWLAEQMGNDRGLAWHEVRAAAIDAYIEEMGGWPEGEGIGSSDGNHMIHSLVHGEVLESVLDRVAEQKAERDRFVREIAGDRDPAQVLAELREFFRPLP